MFCSPCAPCESGTLYSSVSTPSCVTLCGAGLSTFVANPNDINISSISISSFKVDFLFPSTFSTIVTNPCFSLCGDGISTNITNQGLSVVLPSTISTFLVNPTLNVNLSTGATVTVQGNNFDAFSRLITETPTTLLTAHPAFTPQYEIIGYTSTGTGHIFVDISNTIVLMSTSGSGGRAVRQTLEYQLYQPAKSHFSYFTWTPQFSGTFDNSVAVRCGIYDDFRDKNTPAGITGPPPFLYASSINGGLGVETNQTSMGHFFELSGNNWFVVERHNSSNNIADITRVPQSNWNVDTLDPALGNNPSGIILSKTTETLFAIERQWLGIGIVRMGIFSGGKEVVCHVFENRGFKIPYTHLNKLPLRFEIEKVAGGSSDPATTGTICFASHIGGDYVPIGALFSLPIEVTINTTRVSQTPRPVLLLRLQQRYCRATIKIKSVDLFGSAAGAFSFIKNPTITGSITWVNHPDPRSMVQYAVFANGTNIPTNTISNGIVIKSGFFSVRTTLQETDSVADLIADPSITSDIKGIPDVFCIAMAGFSANNDVNATAQWIEIT